MSIIFGIFNRKQKTVTSSSIQIMEKALSYWDADDEGIWCKDSLCFGHRMLWNTPQSKLEHLPHIIHINDKTHVLTMDARLDNREVLVEQLKMADLPFEKITDSELILAAYRKWGTSCPKYLLGDFVFVIWDANKEQLFFARDHIGIKPFYYYLSDDLFVFSNDIRGVIAHPQISKKYNDKAIAVFLADNSNFYDIKDTFFKEIQKLPAATSMTITNNNIAESTYWDIENISEVHYNTYEEYVEKLRAILLDAVKVRLRTVYPVASHLSGGLDSSSLAVLAARELEKRDQVLYAFNWVETPDIENDPNLAEWGFATQLASLENIEQKNIKLTAGFIAEMYDRLDFTKEDASFFWGEYLVRDEAEKYKVRTFLSGWGGDDLISYDGYAYLSGLLHQMQFIKAIQKIYEMYSFKKKKYKYLRVIKRLVREWCYPIFYKRMSGLYKKEKSGIDLFEFAQDQFVSSSKGYALPDIVFHPGVHNEQKSLFTRGHILQRIENWASSSIAKKLEYSYPLLDKRIVEFSLAVPEDLFAWKSGHQRYFFRSVISDFLPKNIVWEPKISEDEHGKVYSQLWYEALILWMKKNEYTPQNRNSYVDKSKIIKRIKMYHTNKQNMEEDNIGSTRIVAAILLANLKNDKGK